MPVSQILQLNFATSLMLLWDPLKNSLYYIFSPGRLKALTSLFAQKSPLKF